MSTAEKHDANFSPKELRKLPGKPLWLLLTGILVAIMILLGAAILFGISWMYQNRIRAQYIARGEAIAKVAASLIDGETVDRYLDTLEKDEHYELILSRLKTLQKENKIEFLYIAKIVKGGAVFVFDSDEVAPVPLGGFDEWSESYDVVAGSLLNGQRVQPVTMDTKWGWLLVTYEPVLRADGSVAAYVGADISMEDITRERRTVFISTGLILLLVLTISIMLFLYAIRRIVINPIGILVNMVSTYMPVGSAAKGNGSSLAGFTKQLVFSGDNELRILVRAITEMKRRIGAALAEQVKAQEITGLMLDSMPLCCQLWNSDFTTIDCNEAGVRLYGLVNKQEYIERFWEFSPEYQSDGRKSEEKMKTYLQKAFDDGNFKFEWMNQTPNGKPIPSEVMLVRVKYGDDYVVAAYTRDLRDIREMEDDIRLLKSEVGKAYFDALTGINNRRFFDENLKHIIKSFSRSHGILSLMMVDIDFFKSYNDTYGHIQGDNCLKEVAQTMAKSVTRTEDFIARYGGEEFAVVLPNTDENGALVIAERLLENIRGCKIPHSSSAAADCVTVSIGITTGRVTHSLGENDFILRADEALYKSKQNGRNRYTFEKL